MDLKLLTQKEVGEVLRLSQSSVDNLRKNGSLPYIKIGSKIYVREQDINKYLADNTHVDTPSK